MSGQSDLNHGSTRNAEDIADELVASRPVSRRGWRRRKYPDCEYVHVGGWCRVRKLSAAEVAEFRAAVQRVIDR